MRVMMKVSIPVEGGNRAVRDGSFAKTLLGFAEEHKPEASYFLTEGGKRTAIFFFDLKDPSHMPAISKPFFLNLDAGIDWCPALDLADLRVGFGRAAIG